MVNLRAADGDWRGGLGGDAVAKASHVALRGSDLEVVTGVRLEVWDDRLSQSSIHLHLLAVILHLEGGRGLMRLEYYLIYKLYADDIQLYFNLLTPTSLFRKICQN